MSKKNQIAKYTENNLVTLGDCDEVFEGAVGHVIVHEEGHDPLKRLQILLIVVDDDCEVFLRELDRLFRLLQSNELDQLLQLKLKKHNSNSLAYIC